MELRFCEYGAYRVGIHQLASQAKKSLAQAEEMPVMGAAARSYGTGCRLNRFATCALLVRRTGAEGAGLRIRR